MSDSIQAMQTSSGQSDSHRTRERLLELVDRCQHDRFAYFPSHARELPWKNGFLDVVLMGGQKSSLNYHLDLIEYLIKMTPGLRLRAIVDEIPGAIVAASRVLALGAKLVTVRDFFENSSSYRDCIIVDRYCTWIPGIKYRAKLKQSGLAVLRWEQFLNAPGLPIPAAHYLAHSDLVLAQFDNFLAIEKLWEDDHSRNVYYTTLAAYASLDFTWFAFTCGNHDERYMPSDIGLKMNENEVFVDCGAHDGAESIIFATRVRNNFRRICAFEPDRKNYAVVCKNLARYMGQHQLDNIVCYPLGVYDRNAYLSFSGKDVTVTLSDQPAGEGPGLFVARLDDLIDEMSYLKLEIEGAELGALNGARDLIRRQRPVMAISAYHKPTDFPDLTGFVRELDMGYTMKLRHQSLEAGVLCIYAQPNEG